MGDENHRKLVVKEEKVREVVFLFVHDMLICLSSSGL